MGFLGKDPKDGLFFFFIFEYFAGRQHIQPYNTIWTFDDPEEHGFKQ